MLYNKFQYDRNGVEISKNDYFQTAIVKDEKGKPFLAKWILGISKNSLQSKLLSDKFRHLQKTTHPMLPKIVQYGYDEEEGTYAIVYEYIGCSTLEDYYSWGENHIPSVNEVLLGLSDVADCLYTLHSENIVSHGNLAPSNILVDSNNSFHLLDFGLADIMSMTCHENNQQLFDAGFAAPEKISKKEMGFPYQADVYSFGKIIEWVYEKVSILSLSDGDQRFLHERMLAQNPAERPPWKDVVEFMERLCVPDCVENIRTDLHKLDSAFHDEYLSNLNSVKPRFMISRKQNDERWAFLGIATDKYNFQAIWNVRGQKLILLGVKELKREPSKRAKTFNFEVRFSEYDDSDVEISNTLHKWLQEKNQEWEKRRRKRENARVELDFYEELMDKEIEVIRKNSLRLQYDNFEVKDNEVHFSIVENEKCSSPANIWRHIDNGNDVNADPIRYVVSENGKIGKKPVKFIGTPLYFEQCIEGDGDSKRYCFKIKDHQDFDLERTPMKGFLMEDCAVKIEEKRRQKEALRKVRNNEVQNVDLIYSLFKPEELKGNDIDYANYKIDIKQKGIEAYSYNQKKAIVNALQRTPLSVIQGPPGTGKTTVITEIVFQILEQKPDAKILITSQTNNAVDQVLENLLKNDIPILRLNGLTEPRMDAIRKHTISQKVRGWKNTVSKKAKTNLPTFENRPDFEELKRLHYDWLTTIANIKEDGIIMQRLVNSIRVIGATCNHIASKNYSKFNFEFDYIIMDESGKATVAESLVPIVMGNNLIYVGDHRQLRPMLTADKEVENWLREKYNKEEIEQDGWDEYFNRPSLFESVIDTIDENYKTQLTECRRSSEEQVNLTSECFYEPEGDDAIEYIPRPNEKEHNLPLAIDGSVFMIDIGSEHPHEQDGNTSSYNRESIKTVASVLSELNKYDKIRDYSVGLITAYSAQYRRLRSKIRSIRDLNNIRNWRQKKDEDKFTLSVIDRFQGLERDIVIVDLVKSGPNLNLGFLETPNRINVALSRQKKLLIIIGDYAGLTNARTPRCNKKEKKCALQMYLKKIPENQIIKSSELEKLFK